MSSVWKVIAVEGISTSDIDYKIKQLGQECAWLCWSTACLLKHIWFIYSACQFEEMDLNLTAEFIRKVVVLIRRSHYT